MSVSVSMRAWALAGTLLIGAALGACSRTTGLERVEATQRVAATVPASATIDAGAPSLFTKLYDDPSLFTWKKKAKPGEWLDRFSEPGQTFTQYEVSRPVRPTEQRKKLVLQPLGVFAPDDDALLAKMKEHLEIFYALPVEMRAAVPLGIKRKRTRHEEARTWVQYHTGAIMDEILKKRLPEDAVVYVGITTADLYPDEEWNFVFGQARFEERVGVYSVARMFERFEGRPDTDATKVRGLARSLAILSHETGHAFGIAHCTRFECVMNGSNSLEELDTQFADPCPVCLRKIAWNIGLDPIRRYEKLRDFYRREHVDQLANWIDRRLDSIAPH